MNRTTAATLIAAAVVGIVGGSVSAVVRGSDDPGADGPAAASTPTPSAEKPTSDAPTSATSPSAVPEPAETNEPLLYADGDRIHDGATVVRFAQGTVQRLSRASGGWLVATTASVEDDASFFLWWVTKDAPARRIAEVSTWDPDADGKRVVAYDVKAGQVKVWSLPDRTVTGVYATEGSPVLTPAFAGEEVLIAQDIDTQVDLVRWNPDTGKSKITGSGFADLSLSPGGSYLAGAVGPEGLTTYTDACRRSGLSCVPNTCLHVESTFLKQQNVSWTTCDWRGDGAPVRFSPDGTRLIAIPSASDGFGPGEFGIIDASDGPRKMVATVTAPPLTLGAQWGDNDHLYLFGSNTDDPATGGYWIKRCDFEGSCTQVARSKGMLTVGSGS